MSSGVVVSQLILQVDIIYSMSAGVVIVMGQVPLWGSWESGSYTLRERWGSWDKYGSYILGSDGVVIVILVSAVSCPACHRGTDLHVTTCTCVVVLWEAISLCHCQRPALGRPAHRNA